MNNSLVKSVCFYILWILGTALSMRFMAYRLDITNLSDAILIPWLIEIAFTIGCVQGIILCTHSWKVSISWVLITGIGGVLAFVVGQFLSFFLMFPYIPLYKIGFFIGGALLGGGQSLILRKFPRAFVIIPATATAYMISWPMLSIILLQASGPYPPDPSNADFIYTITKIGVLLGTIQGAGLLYILNKPPQIQRNAN